MRSRLWPRLWDRSRTSRLFPFDPPSIGLMHRCGPVVIGYLRVGAWKRCVAICSDQVAYGAWAGECSRPCNGLNPKLDRKFGTRKREIERIQAGQGIRFAATRKLRYFATTLFEHGTGLFMH